MRIPEIIDTAEGPMASGSSPQLLRELLAEVERMLSERGAPVSEYLLPGASLDHVRNQLARVGLEAPDEVIEWFGWHNGIKYASGKSGGTPDTPGRRVLPRFPLADLESAIDRYRWSVLEQTPDPEIGDDILFWGVGKGWLRLVDSNYGCAIDCSTTGDQPARIRYASPELELTPRQFRAVSLCTLVTWWIQGLNSGAYTWNLETQSWDMDEARLPPSQTHALFV